MDLMVPDLMVPTYTETMDANINLSYKQHHRHPEKQCFCPSHSDT